MKRSAPVESSATEDYLKVVWNAREWSDEPVTVGALAIRLGLAASSVSEAVRKLTERGLLTHARYGAIELTAEGRRIALATVRKHRLIETFLVDYLGYTWDQVHDEAEVLEHAVSDAFIERLAQRLGEPERDPHGDPIPRADGSLPTEDQTTLEHAAHQMSVRVTRVSDSDPQVLRRLDELGITIGTVLLVGRRWRGGLEIEYAGTQATLDDTASRAIRVALA